RAYQYGEGPRMGTTNDGQTFGITSPQYGAEIAYRIAPGTTVTGPVRLAILDASGDTISTLNGAGGAGLQRVTWPYRGTRKLATVPPLSPASLRDSIVRARKTLAVFDSVA